MAITAISKQVTRKGTLLPGYTNTPITYTEQDLKCQPSKSQRSLFRPSQFGKQPLPSTGELSEQPFVLEAADRLFFLMSSKVGPL